MELTSDHRRAAAQAVATLSTELDLPAQLSSYETLRWTGAAHECSLLMDDVSAIPFLIAVEGVEEYQHRARVRAGTGDVFVAVTEPAEGYEDYCQERLGLGNPQVVVADPVHGPLAVAQACVEGRAFAELTALAKARGSLCVHPYMGIEDVWQLAAKLTKASGADIQVIAPPPPVTWIANDKALFNNVVSRVLGADWTVATHVECTTDSLAQRLRQLCSSSRRVALKRARCASSMGNIVYEAAEILAESMAATVTRVAEFLERTEWDGNEEVLAVSWADAVNSPSSQLWIPPSEAGPPVLEGIYVQILKGTEQVFVGSRPTTLPDAVNEQIGNASLRVAAALQALGYVGRCSFDFLVTGDMDGEFRLLFTECNGRWGGTSTPMHLMNRLFKNQRPPYRAQDFVNEGLVGVAFPEILERVGDHVYDPRTGDGRFIFYNVGPLEAHGKLDVIGLGASQDEAEAALEVELPALLGL